jgi:putative Mg2+ transporter-C (MgtC) family protein
MVQLTFITSSLLLASTASGLTARTKFSSRSTISNPYTSQVVTREPRYFEYRSHGQSNSRLTSTYVEARHISRPFLSVIPKKVAFTLQSLSKTFKRRRPQKILIGTILAIILLFGPSFSPAAHAASTISTSAAPVTAAPVSRALGSFNFLPTKAELELCFRLLYAACSGAFIGLERSSQDRPAGVRTMALVGLGACIFTVCSTHGFLPAALGHAPGSPVLANVKCDPSRMAANVASGVGFIGAGAIHKSKLLGKNGSEALVAGLTTAAAIWVSAAVGVASATGLYFVSAVASLSTVGILKFARVAKEDEPGFLWGPRPLEMEEESMVVHQEKKSAPLNFDVRYLQDNHILPSMDGLHQQKISSTDKTHRPEQSSVSKINIKTVKDAKTIESYLRQYDKVEGYACLKQDVRAVESRVQSSSSFQP